MSYGILMICAVCALAAIFMNLWAVGRNPNSGVRSAVTVLLVFTAMRYAALIVYGDSPDYSLLQQLRYFYFASSIGLTMTTLFACWYVIPYLREKLEPLWIPVIFLPWNLFYLYVIIKQPTQIIKGSQFGYRLALTGRFPFYLSVAQGSMIVIVLLICIIGMLRYKHLQIRVQLFFILASQVLLALDGMSYYLAGARVFPPFTLTEAFGFVAAYYAFSKPVKLHAKTVEGM